MKSAAEFFDTATIEKAEQLTDFLESETPFTVKDAEVSSHNIHYWIKQGLFPDKGESWAIKMNFLEFVWLRILSELRTLGAKDKTLSPLYTSLVKTIDNYALYKRLAANPIFIEQLQIPEPEKKKLRELVLSGKWEQQAKLEKEFSALLLLIAETIAKRSFVSIAVFPSGEYLPIVDSTMHLIPTETMFRLKTETHVVVSITKILTSVLGNERFTSIIPSLNYFPPDQLNLLELITSGEYDSIKIRFSNKRMDVIELEKHEDVHKRLVDILSENKFQSIAVSQQHGKISRIISTVKIKVP